MFVLLFEVDQVYSFAAKRQTTDKHLKRDTPQPPSSEGDKQVKR